MDFRDFVEHMRQEVREEGFISKRQLASRTFTRLKDRGLVGELDPDRVLSQIECEDIHKIQFTTSIAVDVPRVSDLYFYNPWGK